MPLLFGSADRGHGVTRLLKLLRHETAGIAATVARLGIERQGPALAQVLRTIHTAHGGKLSLAQVGPFAWRRHRATGPLVVEHSFGKGRVMAFLTTAAPTWNNWAGNPGFVVVMQDLEAI